MEAYIFSYINTLNNHIAVAYFFYKGVYHILWRILAGKRKEYILENAPPPPSHEGGGIG
jgi:hypothetical protein